MDSLVEIAFKGNRKEFFRWSGDAPPPLGAAVIVEADRGEDLGIVHSVGEMALLRSHRLAHGTHGELPDKRILRLATSEERRVARELREQHDEQARRRARELVQRHGLIMKVTDAEWQLDRRKLTLYFTAEKRVDFRALVRDLASTFRARIELKQIGVRDEARRLSGIGRCGREYCSASWLPELLPVNLGVAKDQRLSLNPTQISGACGRLMCCLRYEHEFYVQSRKRFPKEGKILVTSVGEERVVANDIFRERVTLRNAEGDVRVVPLAALKQEIAEAAGLQPESGDREDARQHARILHFGEGETREHGSRALPLLSGSDSRQAVGRETLPTPTFPERKVFEAGPTPAPPGATPTDRAGRPEPAEPAANDAPETGEVAAGGGAPSGEEAPPRKRRRRGRRGGRRARGARGRDVANGEATPQANEEAAGPDDAGGTDDLHDE